ncbi:hypothetical protein CsatA_028376 [Cannabis sativa]
MESILNNMNSTLCLSEKERVVHSLDESDLSNPNQTPKNFLVARCLADSVNPKTFIKKMGEFWSNKCRFEVIVSEMHSDLFLLTLACAGDQRRILSGEPWHFFNQLILLHLPSSLQNVTKEDLSHVQFWVQTHRLPFLSKSRALAKKVEEWIGEFVDVHEESLHEGWGSFLRTRVRIDVNQPLMRGKMVSLPCVKDEYWLEFRYENLPVFCFCCGKLGHPFEKCLSFMEKVDAGIDPDLEYGPQLMGAKLPSSCFERYRMDFSKTNAYPFITRLTRKTMVSSIPALQSNSNFSIGIKPHPQPLTIAESSSTEKPVTTLPDKCPEMPLPFPSYNPTIFSADIPQIPPSLLKDPQSTQSSHPSSISPVTEAATTTTGVGKNKGKSVIIEETSDDAPAFSKSFKRQVDPENFRSILKRCRGNSKEYSYGDDTPIQQFFDKSADFVEGHSSFSAEVVSQQPRHQP